MQEVEAIRLVGVAEHQHLQGSGEVTGVMRCQLVDGAGAAYVGIAALHAVFDGLVLPSAEDAADVA
ncbi:hypothetical protein [Chromatocurvus halotolerans]|uniref:hypothetical protein n=1 Tax=Chromatocurvus halotolerans TaxID=1132028 RepID=UPI001044DCD5|nr:hypothetical protein [Chromatocurvus halotolerans]